MQETDVLKKSLETKEQELLALQEKLDAREKASPLSLCRNISMHFSVTSLLTIVDIFVQLITYFVSHSELVSISILLVCDCYVSIQSVDCASCLMLAN